PTSSEPRWTANRDRIGKTPPFKAAFVPPICYTSRPPFSGLLSDVMSATAVGGHRLRFAHNTP
ncbi:hypothetical protein, partial [Aeromonas cavernicola]|uniref:hypothetical protein n=1 Tax=Aeromonas cavernicola TaxID=1006623 RepID=UPI001F23409D